VRLRIGHEAAMASAAARPVFTPRPLRVHAVAATCVLRMSMLRLLVAAAVLGSAVSVHAQVVPLGGGVAPLFVAGSPQLGQTLQISPFPAPFPAVIVGLARADMPLAPFGAGCPDTLVPSLDLILPVACSLAIPSTPSMVGFTLYAQGMLGGVGICNVGFPVQLTSAVRITIQP
jgi:hypothetical protein